MNHAINHPTRWSCRIVRSWKALVSDTPRATGFGARHIAHCRECQRYFAASHAIEMSLRRDAPSGEAPAGLDDRIMRAIRNAEKPATRRSGFHRFSPVLAGAAVAALALLFSLPRVSESPHAKATRPITSSRTVMPPAGADATPGSTSWASLTAPVASVLDEDPLQNEVNSVYADARSAVGFLAMNFLPAGTVGTGTSLPRDPSASPRG